MRDPAPPAAADVVALRLCAALGVPAEGPIGRRLLDTCRAMPSDRLQAAGRALGRPGVGADLQPFFDAATNRETYFFRDRRQLGAVGRLLADRAPGEGLRVWSAGCATGEEAYSLAILARRALPAATLSVLGTDISAGALKEATAGTYRTGAMSSCRDIGPEEEPWLPRIDQGLRRTIDPAIRRLVRFSVHNLLEGLPDRDPFDLVVCRNVILYMTAPARRRAVATLAQGTRPGGYMVLGTGDCSDPSIPVDAGFAPVEIDGLTFFRRTPT